MKLQDLQYGEWRKIYLPEASCAFDGDYCFHVRRGDASRLMIYLCGGGVSWDRETLKQRIDERLEKRLQQGMVKEVEDLLSDGCSEEFLMKLGLEYRYLTRYIKGEIGYDQMVLELGNAIKKFAKRQVTWFKKDPDIHWLDMHKNPAEEAAELIEKFLGI